MPARRLKEAPQVDRTRCVAGVSLLSGNWNKSTNEKYTHTFDTNVRKLYFGVKKFLCLPVSTISFDFSLKKVIKSTVAPLKGLGGATTTSLMYNQLCLFSLLFVSFAKNTLF